MARRLSALISAALLLSFLIAAAPASADNKKKDLEKEAKAAEKAGDTEKAGSLFCELIQIDTKNKNAKKKCDDYTQRLQAAQDTKDAQTMATGKAALADHRFQEAINAFKSVTAARYKDEAARYLSKDIPDAQKAFAADQAARKQREEEARNADRFKKGSVAYQQNDFDTAKLQLSQVAGANAAEAKRILQNIDDYKSGFDQGFKFEKAGKQKQAVDAYRKILKIKADGPWEVSKKVAKLEKEMRAAAAAAAEKAAAEKPAAPLSADDNKLAEAISGFYRGEYQQSQDKLASYSGDGPRKALALFYLGACELSQYLLAAGDPPKDLYDKAVEHFRAARKTVPAFAPPEQYISPRVMKVFSEAGS